MLSNLTCVHTLEKKRTLLFLIHAHFAQLLLYLVMYLVIIFKQNKLTTTFNKVITSGKSDVSYPPCWPPKWAAS